MWRCRSPARSGTMSDRSPRRWRRGGCAGSTTLVSRSGRWGRTWPGNCPRIYERESVVVFVSADYAEGDWTRLEGRAAFSRAVRKAGVYVLPTRFDDSELPGLLEDVVAINLHDYNPGQFADLVVAKLADLGISPSPSPAREVLDPAAVIRIEPELSEAEQDRARAAAARDRQLAVALESAGYGLTQTPRPRRSWSPGERTPRPPPPYGWAVLTAALDVARLGSRARLPARGRSGLLYLPAAGRGSGGLVRAGPGLCHRQGARRCRSSPNRAAATWLVSRRCPSRAPGGL
jgi:hypothetical protein